MTPMTMDLPATIDDGLDEISTATAGPTVPEEVLDEVGRELAGQEEGEVVDAEFVVTDDKPASDSPTVADPSGDSTTTTDPKPTKKTAAEKAAAKAQREFDTQKQDAANNLASAVVARHECEAQLKAAKSLEKAAAEIYERIVARGVVRLPLIDAAEAAAEEREAKAAAGGDKEAVAAPTVDPDAWKSRPITELGLHPSLEEKLTSDGMDTIGRLEQRRADISQGKEKWPKGIGKAKVTQIEDAVIGWLTENQHQVSGQDEPSETEIEATPEMLAKLLVDRAKALNTGDPDCLEPAGDTDNCWDSGVQAFDRGDKLTDCPLTSGVEQDDWLRGWMTAQENHSGETISSDLGDV